MFFCKCIFFSLIDDHPIHFQQFSHDLERKVLCKKLNSDCFIAYGQANIHSQNKEALSKLITTSV